MFTADTFSRRGSGVLLHVSSLPGNTGIGTLGKNAYAFIDFLKEAGQSYWQLLPICPTSYGDSPYQSFSTFAGNPYFIDFDLLADDGLLEKSAYEDFDWGADASSVDYGLLYQNRRLLFEVLQDRFEKHLPPDFDAFCKKNAFWLEDYALFMAVKDAHDGASFLEWEDAIRLRTSDAVSRWKKRCAHRMNCYRIQQYLFFRQWRGLREYAASRNIKIIGDIPIYVAADSADVWTNPQNFLLDENLRPVKVAGCPPDAFSESGQLWGNPVYDWPAMQKDGFSWWKRRLSASLSFYDVLRIDHFRGFDSFYSVDSDAKDAKNGTWSTGPGIGFFDEMKAEFGALPIIAEDLGFLTDSVRRLLAESGFPGMKILQFAFDTRDANGGYFPEDYPQNCVVYTGTHDNDTILGWTRTARPDDVRLALDYYGLSRPEDLREAMLRSALNSNADTCILTLQDLIGLGSEARMNTPSSVGHNWRWRVLCEQLTPHVAAWLRAETEKSGRLG